MQVPGVGDRAVVRVGAPLDSATFGQGRTKGGVRVRLKGVLPRERVQVQVEHVGQDGLRHGRLLSVLEPSPDRTDVPCSHADVCGGCDFLHAAQSFQHRFKRHRVAAALGLPLARVDRVVAAPQALKSRALAKFVVGPGGVLGSYRPRTHELVDMEGCPVHAETVEAIADGIRRHLASAVCPGLRYVVIRASVSEKRAIVVLVARSGEGASLGSLAAHLGAREDVAKVVFHPNDSPGNNIFDAGGAFVELAQDGPLYERIGGIDQEIDAGAFAQVNPLAADVLYTRLVERLNPKGKRILDLYAGSGGLSLVLARAGALRVRSIECVPSAVLAARRSATHNGLESQLECWEGTVETRLQECAGPYDAVVLNPPRKGASPEVLNGILALDPRVLVYISCNPESLARDLAHLGARRPLVLESVTPFDLFPQTRHVETLVVASWGEGAPRRAEEG